MPRMTRSKTQTPQKKEEKWQKILKRSTQIKIENDDLPTKTELQQNKIKYFKHTLEIASSEDSVSSSASDSSPSKEKSAVKEDRSSDNDSDEPSALQKRKRSVRFRDELNADSPDEDDVVDEGNESSDTDLEVSEIANLAAKYKEIKNQLKLKKEKMKQKVAIAENQKTNTDNLQQNQVEKPKDKIKNETSPEKIKRKHSKKTTNEPKDIRKSKMKITMPQKETPELTKAPKRKTQTTPKDRDSRKPDKKMKNDSADNKINASLINMLNSQKSEYTSKDLQLGKAYKMKELKITDEQGFYGAYKKFVAKLERHGKMYEVKLPTQMKKYDDSVLAALQQSMAKEKYPKYIVDKVETKQRSDGQGTYDFVTFHFA